MDARDNTQKTPLHHAAQWGQEEALDFLIECGADVNASDFIEDTPLHLVREILATSAGRLYLESSIVARTREVTNISFVRRLYANKRTEGLLG